MKNIVPVPELIINEVEKSSFKVDAHIYSYFKEKVFFNDFNEYIKKIMPNRDNSLGFESIENIDRYIKAFQSKKKSYISLNNHYYIYNVKSFDWLAIELFEFKNKHDAESYLLSKNKIWKIIRRLFLWFIVK